jgi:inorganic phosphate transporter, PiT family
MPDTNEYLFWLVTLLALGFDYINGFHDAANAIATVVATKVLSPRTAVFFGAILNLAGAMAGTEVAATIGKGLVDNATLTIPTVLVALISAIIWNLITWYLALPTSSSHALIGSLLGAAFAQSGQGVIHWNSVLDKVIKPMLVSPIIGFVAALWLMIGLTWLVHKIPVPWINRVFGKLQLVSAGWMAFSHGSNDAQKSMGIIALAYVILHPTQAFVVSDWIKITCALAMGLGTLSGGWKIIRTLGSKMIKLQPIHGFAAETAASAVIMTASHLGLPLSTTHIISSTIMGAGATRRLSAVKWSLVSKILWAWVLTLPITFSLAWLIAQVIR